MSGGGSPGLTRREFLQAALVGAGTAATGAKALEVFAADPKAVEARFVVLADTHVGSPGDLERLEQAVPRVLREKPAFVLHAGDVVESLVTSTKEVEAAQRLLGQLTAPLRLAPGNHDVGPRDSAELRTAWRQSVGPTEWVFRHGDWAVVGFDSMALAGHSTERALREEVLAFLEKELAGLEPRRTLVLYHLPEFPVPIGSSIAWNDSALARWKTLLERRPPAAALTGHWHLGVRIPLPYPLVVAPPVSGRSNLPTGYLRCSVKGDKLLFERVMLETAGKRNLPTPVKWLLLPEGAAPA